MADQTRRDMGKFFSFKWAILLKKGLKCINLENLTVIISYTVKLMMLHKIMVTQCSSAHWLQLVLILLVGGSPNSLLSSFS